MQEVDADIEEMQGSCSASAAVKQVLFSDDEMRMVPETPPTFEDQLFSVDGNVDYILSSTPEEESFSEEKEEILPGTLVSVHSALGELKEILKSSPCLGLWGMGGIGKTTLAMTLFNDLSPTFEYACFMKEVKLIQGDIENVEREVMKRMNRRGSKLGGSMSLEDLRGKRLLLVLDDVHIGSGRDLEILRRVRKVNNDEQSRFIVTSCDQEHMEQVEDIHIRPVCKLDQESSRQLFMSHAFRDRILPPLLENYVTEMVEKCDGLPLSLVVLGKYLNKKDSEGIWRQSLEALDEADAAVSSLEERLWARLRLSYENLNPREKEVFLDTATFFAGMFTLRMAKLAWSRVHGNEHVLWKTLVDLSLVHDVGEDEVIGMDEQLMSLGRKISTDQESTTIEGDSKCVKRVWDNETLNALLQSLVASEDCVKEVVSFWLPRDDVDGLKRCNSRHIPYSRMEKLRYLQLYEPQMEEGELLPPGLVVLNSWRSSLEDLPLDPSHSHDLVFLRLNFSFNLRGLPASFCQLSALQHLVLYQCHKLDSLPDTFGKLPQLRRLQIWDCPRLCGLPESFGDLSCLRNLEMFFCSQIQTLPESFGRMRELETLSIYSCVLLSALPESFCDLSSLRCLKIKFCPKLEALPDSFGRMSALEEVILKRCSSLRALPESFGDLSALKHFRVRGCNEVSSMPESFGRLPKLEKINFDSCDGLESLPQSFGDLSSLRFFDMTSCHKMETLPDSFGQLSLLEQLTIRDCDSLRVLPESLGEISALRIFSLEECEKIDLLPDSLGRISSLEHLSLDGLSIRSVPDSFGYLNTLKELCIQRCPLLSSLPTSLGNLQALEHLAICFAPLTAIPDWIQTLPRLKVLRLGALPSLTDWPRWLADGDVPQPVNSSVTVSIEDGRAQLLDTEEVEAMTDELMKSKKSYVKIMGETKKTEGKFAEALEFLDAACRLDPHDAEALCYRMFVKAMLLDYRGALEDADNLIEMYSYEPVLWQERGVLKRMMGDLDGALADLDTGLNLGPDDYDRLKHRGYVKFLMADLEGARTDAQHALEIKPAYAHESGYGVSNECLGYLRVHYLDYDL